MTGEWSIKEGTSEGCAPSGSPTPRLSYSSSYSLSLCLSLPFSDLSRPLPTPYVGSHGEEELNESVGERLRMSYRLGVTGHFGSPPSPVLREWIRESSPILRRRLRVSGLEETECTGEGDPGWGGCVMGPLFLPDLRPRTVKVVDVSYPHPNHSVLGSRDQDREHPGDSSLPHRQSGRPTGFTGPLVQGHRCWTDRERTP